MGLRMARRAARDVLVFFPCVAKTLASSRRSASRLRMGWRDCFLACSTGVRAHFFSYASGAILLSVVGGARLLHSRTPARTRV